MSFTHNYILGLISYWQGHNRYIILWDIKVFAELNFIKLSTPK